MQVHIETLKVSERASYTSGKGKNAKTIEFDRHTVEVTIGQDRRAVPCSAICNNAVTIYGLAVRFRTGAKVWPASAVYWLQGGHVNNLRPNIDKFNGQFCTLVGYMADFEDEPVRSRHNAVA